MSKALSHPLILASGSSSRAKMLQAAGLAFHVIPASINEAALRTAWLADDPAMMPAAIAVGLSRAKAEDVSRRYPDALVIGSDQVLALGGETISKAASRAEAREALVKLRGREHRLHSAVALAMAGTADWSVIDTAVMVVRTFSDEFLEQYLDQAGDALTTSAGAYRVEEIGLQLFDRIEGNHFTIMGLPLMALIAELRHRGILGV